jgi:PIN domain nuclease of toxin-antitoxin system
MVLIDTHVAVFLHGRQTRKLSLEARVLLDNNDIVLPEMARLELQYLNEIGRISETPANIIQFLYTEIGLTVSKTSMSRLVDKANLLTWTRDPFDRLICADAGVHNIPLITHDQKILANFPQACC